MSTDMCPDEPGLPTWMGRLAHDLRNPLTPLMTAVYLLKNEQLPADKRTELLDLMERQGQRLGQMLDELDDSIRAGQGRLLGQRESCDAGVLLELAFGEIRQAPTIDVIATSAAARAAVDGDLMRLQQMLRILVEHALAQADADVLTVRLERLGDWVRIDIPLSSTGNDDGPTDALLREPRPDMGDTGLGLKLLLARSIAHAHGGHLSVHSSTPEHPDAWLRCELPLANGHASL